MDIPVLDVPPGTEPAIYGIQHARDRFELLLCSARRTYTRPGLAVADRLSAVWARRAGSPYGAAIAQVQARVGHGAYMLNHSYEWGCTAGVHAGRLMRTLDWPFDGLGQALIVTRWDGGAGPYWSVTWPGVVGVLTGLAPGRFAAAINQPPLPRTAGARMTAWPVARWRVARQRALSPTHALRHAFDHCPDYASADAWLRTIPLCIPAIFTIAGPNDGEAVVIERTERHAFEPTRAVAANHWTSQGAPPGQPRNLSSHSRHRAMCSLMDADPQWSLDWVQAPILQPDTRVAVLADPRAGRMLVQGWESSGPVTTVLSLGA